MYFYKCNKSVLKSVKSVHRVYIECTLILLSLLIKRGIDFTPLFSLNNGGIRVYASARDSYQSFLFCSFRTTVSERWFSQNVIQKDIPLLANYCVIDLRDF